MKRRLGFRTLLVKDNRKEYKEAQERKRQEELAAGIKSKTPRDRSHFLLRNASLFYEDTTDDRYGRLTVLVDSTRRNYTPRKILFSLGYTQLRKIDRKRLFLLGRDESGIDVMLLVDIASRRDRRGYPVPFMNATRAHMLEEIADTYIDEHRGTNRLRVDHVSLPADYTDKAILKLTCKRGLYWAEGHSEEVLEDLRRYRQKVDDLSFYQGFDFVFDEQDETTCVA